MFARTERLLLRPGWVEDAPALAAAIGDIAVSRNLARVPFPYAEADALAYLSRQADPRLPNFQILLRTKGVPRLVGGAGLHRGDDGRPELGYWIARPYWGLGFATEAAGQVMRIARAMKLPRIAAGHYADNPASGRVLAKIGFRPTGRVEARPSLGRGHTVPCVMFEESDGKPMPDNAMFREMIEEHDRALAA